MSLMRENAFEVGSANERQRWTPMLVAVNTAGGSDHRNISQL
jgi:hypothetical protein